MEQKRKIIGSIFPEKLIFDGEHYRTARVNEAIRAMFAIDEAFRQKENGTSLSVEDLSHLVIPLGLRKVRSMPYRSRQLGLAGQVKLILAGEYLFVIFRKRKRHNGPSASLQSTIPIVGCSSGFQ